MKKNWGAKKIFFFPVSIKRNKESSQVEGVKKKWWVGVKEFGVWMGKPEESCQTNKELFILSNLEYFEYFLHSE